MRSINAFSLAPGINNWLANSNRPRVLHVFDQACNLINQAGDILSIVTSQIGNGPFNLVVEDDICFSEHLRLESEVSTPPTQLHLGDLTVHTANARVWNPCPDWGKLYARKDDIGQQLTKLRITNYLNSRGLDTPFTKAAPGYSTSVSIQSLVSNLSLALVNADVPLAQKITSQLAGLGIGLTPAGDDYIMGSLYAAWIIHPSMVASVLAKEIANTAAPLTTSLSAAWLRSAGRGEAGILWHEFFDALISEDHIRIEESKKKILAVGETSGADALAGFTDVFASGMEKTGFLHE